MSDRLPSRRLTLPLETRVKETSGGRTAQEPLCLVLLRAELA